MKGTMSRTLQAVLNDPQGREQLKTQLLRGETGKIISGGKEYIVKVEITKQTTIPPK